MVFSLQVEGEVGSAGGSRRDLALGLGPRWWWGFRDWRGVWVKGRSPGCRSSPSSPSTERYTNTHVAHHTSTRTRMHGSTPHKHTFTCSQTHTDTKKTLLIIFDVNVKSDFIWYRTCNSVHLFSFKPFFPLASRYNAPLSPTSWTPAGGASEQWACADTPASRSSGPGQVPQRCIQHASHR